MSNPFFEKPILNSPYACPARHWELDPSGQPTQKIIENRRRADFITPIPKPRKRKPTKQQTLIFDEGKGLSNEKQQYDPTSIINQCRQQVDRWRSIPNPGDWQVTPETARLIQHWRTYEFNGVRPFFCQVEAVETAIWLTEVAPAAGKAGKLFTEHLKDANNDYNPELSRLALKLATGAGKTTVMAMLIAWQTINSVRRPQSQRFSRGFLIVAPGLTIKDRLAELMRYIVQGLIWHHWGVYVKRAETDIGILTARVEGDGLTRAVFDGLLGRYVGIALHARQNLGNGTARYEGIGVQLPDQPILSIWRLQLLDSIYSVPGGPAKGFLVSTAPRGTGFGSGIPAPVPTSKMG